MAREYIGDQLPKGYMDPVADSIVLSDEKLNSYKNHKHIIHKGREYVFIGIAHKKMSPATKNLRTILGIAAVIITCGTVMKSKSFKSFTAKTQMGLTPLAIYTRKFFFAQKVLAKQTIDGKANNEAKLELASSYYSGTTGAHHKHGKLVEETAPRSLSDAKKLYSEVLFSRFEIRRLFNNNNINELKQELNETEKQALIGLCKVAVDEVVAGKEKSSTAAGLVNLAKQVLSEDQFKEVSNHIEPHVKILDVRHDIEEQARQDQIFVSIMREMNTPQNE